MTKRRFLIPTIVLLALLLTGCSFMQIVPLVGSGTVIERNYDVADFTDVSLANNFTAQITQGDTFSVLVRADDNLLDRVTVKVEDGALQIELEDGRPYSPTMMHAEIIMPALSSIALSGASQATLVGFGRQPDFSASIEGASTLDGEIGGDGITLDLSGASMATLRGEGGLLAASIEGGSNAELGELVIENATLSLGGGSDADVTVSGQLDVSASGASEVTYGGGATLGASSLTGASSVTER